MKNRLSLSLIVLALAVPALQGCFPAVVAGAAVGVMSIHDRRTTGTQTDDETTEWRARGTIPEQYKAQSRVNFTSYNRRLLITGEVPNEDAKSVIEAEARKLDGVRVLAKGDFSSKVELSVSGASKSAVEAVEKAGGSLTVTSAKATEAAAE